MIHRHNGCIAITLFRFGRRQLELVYCPAGEVIEPHVHQHIDSTLVMLGGEIKGGIAPFLDGLAMDWDHWRHGKTGWYDFGRRFKIPAGTLHYAKVTGRFCLFLNYEKWDSKPTSAAVDFITQ